MKVNLYYIDSSTKKKTLVNVTEGTVEESIPFYILPDSRSSFVKIIELPSVPKKKIRSMLSFQIGKIYPGNYDGIIYDFMAFKSEAGWKIILYVLKKEDVHNFLQEENFRGIILPLQLVSKKILRTLTHLYIYYPDMIEEWVFDKGAPVGLTRHDTYNAKIENSMQPDKPGPESHFSLLLCSKKFMTKAEAVCTPDEVMSFDQALANIKRDDFYFSELRFEKIDKMTPALSIIALILSVVLLGGVFFKHKELDKAEYLIEQRVETIQQKQASTQEKLEKISALQAELHSLQDSLPLSMYELMVRVSNTLDKDTVVKTISVQDNELSLSLQSGNALKNLEKIKTEFGNVRASSIRSHEDETETYTVWVELQ